MLPVLCTRPALLAALTAAGLVGCRTPAPAPVPACPAPPEPGGSVDAPSSAKERSSATTTILIRGPTVWTAAGKILPRADVLLRDGRIAEVGQGLAAPAGARVVDGKGRHLTPGLVDPHSHLGVFSLPLLAGQHDGNEVGKAISPAARAVDAIWSQDPAIGRALAGGITTALVIPGSANLVGGLGLVIKLAPGRSTDEIAFPGAPTAVKMACGENPVLTYREKGGPFTRMGSLARLRQLFQRAQEYDKGWRRFRDKWAEWCRKRAKKPKKEERALPPEPPKRDLGLEVMVQVLAGKASVHCHCYRADDMLRMLELAHEFGFRIQAFHHAVEAYKIRDTLARERIAAVTWINWWGFKAEVLDTIPESPALLSSAGALAALHTDLPMVAPRLIQEAAQAYFRGKAAGLAISEDDAIKLVTLNPARVLGIDQRVGSIERGKTADLVLWDGHPFSVYTRAEIVLVDGEPVYHRISGTGASDFALGAIPTAGPLPPLPQREPRLAAPERWRAPLRPADPGAPGLAIVGGLVHTMTGPPARATVLIRGDRIQAVGPAVQVPAGTPTLDVAGRIVTPGLVAAESALGLVEINAERQARDHRGDKPRVRPSLRAADGLNPAALAVPVARTEGVTTAVIRTFGGLVSGQAAAYDLRGLTPSETQLVAPVAVNANLGLPGKRAVGGPRALALARLRQLLDDARLLRRHRAAIEARRFRQLAAPVAELEAMLPVVEGTVPLVVTADRAADILAALALAKEQKIRLVLGGAAEGWRVAAAIARAGAPVLVDVDQSLPDSFDTLGARFDNAARLYRAGVVVGFSSAGATHDLRLLRQLAGIAAAWGLPREAALRGLTAVPAAIYGLQDRGVLVPGARANLVVWSADPLELSSRVTHLVVGGEQLPLVSRQTLLRQRYLQLPPSR